MNSILRRARASKLLFKRAFSKAETLDDPFIKTVNILHVEHDLKQKINVAYEASPSAKNVWFDMFKSLDDQIQKQQMSIDQLVKRNDQQQKTIDQLLKTNAKQKVTNDKQKVTNAEQKQSIDNLKEELVQFKNDQNTIYLAQEYADSRNLLYSMAQEFCGSRKKWKRCAPCLNLLAMYGITVEEFLNGESITKKRNEIAHSRNIHSVIDHYKKDADSLKFALGKIFANTFMTIKSRNIFIARELKKKLEKKNISENHENESEIPQEMLEVVKIEFEKYDMQVMEKINEICAVGSKWNMQELIAKLLELKFKEIDIVKSIIYLIQNGKFVFSNEHKGWIKR